MFEENKENDAPFDAELEIVKLQGRFRWIVGELEELKQKDRSLSARISRLRLKAFEEPEELEETDRQDLRAQVENMSLEERALLFARLSERE